MSTSMWTVFSLGVTMSVILDLPYTVSIWISAAVAITYTLLGGLYSVAYTDIIQLILIFISLVSIFTSWFMLNFPDQDMSFWCMRQSG